MLPSTPPSSTVWTIKRGMTGWPVYALQSFLGNGLAADAVFGGATEVAVGSFQRHEGLTADGIAGPVTQGALLLDCIEAAEGAISTLPEGLLRGKLLTESGLMLGAVNWSVPGGVDCGGAQYRVYGPPYAVQFANSGASLMQAFGAGCVKRAARDFIERRDGFLVNGAWSKGNYERAGRCAALAHNWPSGALYYSNNGHAPSPLALATWVPAGVRFPDGTLVRTRQDWAEFYAMGGAHGPGKTTRYVTSWK